MIKIGKFINFVEEQSLKSKLENIIILIEILRDIQNLIDFIIIIKLFICFFFFCKNIIRANIFIN